MPLCNTPMVVLETVEVWTYRAFEDVSSSGRIQERYILASNGM